MNRMPCIKRWMIIWMAFLLFFGGSTLNLRVSAREEEKTQEEPKELYARSAVLMDADSGRILFAKDGDTARAMASTTKIMTCILALERAQPKERVTISENAQNQPKVRLGVREGEEYLLEDLLYSLMLESHNDSAVAIAEHIGGSVEGFAKLMNKKAKELGCTHTHFITPNGLDAADGGGKHATTAAELAAIMKYCIHDSDKREQFLKIVQTPAFQFANGDETRTFSGSNHNAFLQMMEGAIAGKTGFTGDAGYCYVGALQRGERTFIVALLACGWPNNKSYKWSDTRKLMEYGIANYQYKKVWDGARLPELPVLEGTEEAHPFRVDTAVPLYIEGADPGLHVLLGRGEAVHVDYQIPEQILAPVKKGSKVGTVVYRIDEKPWKTYAIRAGRTMERRSFGWCMKQISLVWLTGILK